MALVVVAGCTTSQSRSGAGSPATSSAIRPTRAAAPGRWRHVIIVIEENHSYDQIMSSTEAPYMHRLAAQGANFTNAFAEVHPSQPNYIALMSGSTQGVTDDGCLSGSLGADNLANQLLNAGYSFTGYAEGLPSPGSTVCHSDRYARKHCPWVNFSDIPGDLSQPMTSFPTDLNALPTVSFVIPDLDHDMHDGTIAQADTWLHDTLGGYASWASSHDSLLLVTWDEDNNTTRNQIPTIAVGAHVQSGRQDQRITHYSMLRTLEDAYGLAPLGQAAQADAVTALDAH